MFLNKAFANFIIKRTFAAKLRNKGMNTFSNFEILKNIRSSAELKRIEENRPHEVMYFHKVDDPYSHLAIQYIDKLQESFDISFQAILVGEENSDAVHEPSLYSNYCLDDAKRIAPFFDVKFSAKSYPSKELVAKSNKILTAVDNKNFSEVAKKLSSALWSSNESILDDLAREYSATDEEV